MIMNKLKQLYNWVASDGLLHILINVVIMLTFTLILNVWWALLISISVSLIKEGIDCFIRKSNNKQQVIHDLICDAVGILLTLPLLIYHYLML